MSVVAVVAGLILTIGVPVEADLPPTSQEDLQFSVSLGSDVGGFSEVFRATFDKDTGKASVTATEQDLGAQATAGVTFDLQVDVDADPKITYSLTIENGAVEDLTVDMNIISVAQPFDETDQGKHSLEVTGVDLNGGGVTITSAMEEFGRPGFFMQEARAGAQDLIDPPFVRTGTDPIGGPLFTSGTALGAGPTSDSVGPVAVPSSANIGSITPDGKFNIMTLALGATISAGDKATFEGELEIGKNLGGGGGGGEAFPDYAGNVPGKLIANVKKIAKVKDTEYSLGVSVTESDFEFTSTDPAATFGGTAEVTKNGKKILMTLDAPGLAALEAMIEAILTAAAATPVDVEFLKTPTAKGSVKKDGAKAKFSVKAKISATTAEVSKNSTVKIKLKGSIAKVP
jgi:hypothetical protein